MLTMLIIEKENILNYNYRYAIGKITFLEIYDTEFEFLKNFDHSNLILVKSKSDGAEIYISLFRKAEFVKEEYELPLNQEIPIITYYESKSKEELSDKIKKLSNEFINLYQKNLEDAFNKPSDIINNLKEPQKNVLASLYMSPSTCSMKLYKYRSQASIEKNEYKVLNGCISFCPPSSFNDPFDCNIVFERNQDMSNIFKVLCLTESYENILMWSYYGDSHKGYCIEYESSCINEKISENQLNGVCIVGKVDYKNKRPKIKAPVSKFSYTDIKFYIDASFTKFKDWEHEKEYRYVVISDTSGDSSGYLELETTIAQIYQGVKGQNYNYSGKPKCEKLSKNSTSYGFVVNKNTF